MKRRRLLLGILIALVALAGVGTAGVAALPGIVRWVTVRQLAAATGRPVSVDAVDLSLRHGRLAVRGIRVIDRDGAPLTTLARVDVRFSPWQLLRGRIHVTDAKVDTFAVRVVRTGPNQYNVSDLLARRAERGGKAPVLTIERLAVVGGAIVIEDRTVTPVRVWRVEPLELHARGASTLPGAPPGDATVTAAVAGKTLTLSVTDVRLSPVSFRAALTAREVDVSLAALFVPPASPLSSVRGALSVDVKDFHVAPDLVEVDRVAVDGAVVLEDARLGPVRSWRVDGIAIEARGLTSARDAPPGVATARATTTGTRTEVWVTNVRLAPLELNATAIVRNVDLSLFRLALPPGLPMRPERGVIDATVRLDYDDRAGARVGVDAGLRNVELQRPAHFITAPSMRVTGENITLDGGAVGVGRMTVAGDRLTLEERSVTPVRTWAVRDLAVEARDLSTRRDVVQGVATLRATVAGATASVFVTDARLDPLELRAAVVLRNIDAAVLRLYLPSEMPLELGRGVVNATVQIDHAVRATKITGDASLTGFEARGRGAFATLSVAAPAARVTIADGLREGENLSVGRVEIGGSGTLTDQRGAAARFDFTRLELAMQGLTWPVRAPAGIELSMRFQDRGELEGSGTARLTAPLPTIAWTAELALKFRGVDLAPLAVYMPAAAGFGGRVRADVTTSLTYAGALTARVRGDVGGARFALVEGGRTLVSLRSIAAIGLDLEWPERLSIKQLRLREPYGLVTRDRQGAISVAARVAAPRTAAADAPAGERRRPTVPAMAIGEVVVDNGSAAFVDETVTPAVRVDMPRVNLTARNVTWPASAPIDVALEGTFPSGGTFKATGTAGADPPTVDLTVACQDADLAALQPYLGVRARFRGRLTANLTVAGPVSPAPRVKLKGDVGLQSFEIADDKRPVLTADRLRITGLDADWPTRVTLDRVRLRRSWALIERDGQGRFLLRTLLERRDAGGPTPPAGPTPSPAPAASALEFTMREAIFEEQAATIVDGMVSPPARIEVAGARLSVRDFVWPSRAPATVALTSPMPGGGQLTVTGAVQLEPMRLDARAVLDGVSIEPAQPYVPIEGQLAGKATGDVSMKLALDPTSLQITGQARLQAFRLNDGARTVMTVGRVETSGIDIDWPGRIGVRTLQMRRPRLLVERDAKGDIRFRQLVTPRWSRLPTSRAPGSAAAAATVATPAASAPPTIEVATLTLEKALARFVDQTTTPPYAEELEDLDVTFSPFTTAPGGRTRVAATGTIAGGSFKLEGEEVSGERTAVDLKVDIRNLVVPRANPYLKRHTGWQAGRGSLDLTGHYKLDGTQLDTRQDVVVRGLEVHSVDDRDEVARRIGLPFGMLVSLLKDSRGDVRLSVPVSGDLSKREFDYSEAVWATIRNLSIRLLALPFSKIGSLFFSEDSKVKAVALAPVVFEPGTDHLGAGMDAHLARVAEFLKQTPAVKVILEPVILEADVEVLKQATSGTLPPDALRDLGTRRIEAVRQSLTRAGIDAARIGGTARRAPLVEAAGAPRIEFDLRS